MDLLYIEKKRGFFYDLGLMFRTVWVVLKHEGAE
jgi:lipopolysaccharide/colanic/teichoic acid biosynthesis glycosyltransferase